MATIKQRLDKLEAEQSAIKNDNNLIVIMLNDGETEYDAIVRSGYDQNSNRSKFIFVSFV